MKLLGLGTANLLTVPEQGMRLDAAALEERLDACLRAKRPVLMSVAVLGTTEFGTIDPVHRVIGARDAAANRGLGHWVHVNAAWGGYLRSEEHTSELQSLMRISYAVFCLKKKITNKHITRYNTHTIPTNLRS